MSKVNGQTRTLGLIGNPVEHTLSPFIHNLLAEEMKINMVYVPFDVEKGLLEDAIKGAKALNILGCNVTVPYKVDVMAFVDVLDERARMIEAVNTIKYCDGKLYGYNTDAHGLLNACLKSGIVFDNKTICILGAGGAANSVAILCAQMKVQKIILVNRTVAKAEELKKIVQKYYNLDIEVMTYEALEISDLKIDICFQTTSIGMHPLIEETPIHSLEFFKKVEWAVDIIYNPSETRFLKEAAQMGVKTLNGLGMLFYQAVKSFEIWHELVVPESILETSFERLTNFVYNK